MTSAGGPDAGDAGSDSDLLAAHVAGSSEAFATLVRRHQDRLWAVALRMMHDPDDAADVLQDALVKAFRSAAGFRGEATVTTWLHRIVVNAALDSLRRRTPVPVEPADRPDPQDPIGQWEVAEDLGRALAMLPADQRAAIVLVDLHGFAVDQAAEMLACAPGTVKSRCFRGRSRLADLLTTYAPGNRQQVRHVGPADAASGDAARRDEP